MLTHRLSRAVPLAATAVALTLVCTVARAQTAVATYNFAGILAATQFGVAALTATDPGNTSGFGTDTVFGQTANVYNFVGNTTPAQQAGLTLDTTSLIPPASYSVEMVFKFTDRNNAWRRIIDVQNRQSDNGFYVDTSNNLDIFPVAGSSQGFLTNTYYHVVLTVGGNVVSSYLDGVKQFDTNTAIMNLNNSDNPGQLMNFFLDNTTGGGQGEYSSGSISLLRVYDGKLTDSQVSVLYGGVVAVPEVGTFALMLPVAVLTGVIVRRRIRRA